MSSFSSINVPFRLPITIFSMSQHSNAPVLAVIQSNDIRFLNDQGILNEEKTISRKITPTALEWHPQQRILAIGW